MGVCVCTLSKQFTDVCVCVHMIPPSGFTHTLCHTNAPSPSLCVYVCVCVSMCVPLCPGGCGIARVVVNKTLQNALPLRCFVFGTNHVGGSKKGNAFLCCIF